MLRLAARILVATLQRRKLTYLPPILPFTASEELEEDEDDDEGADDDEEEDEEDDYNIDDDEVSIAPY